MLTIISPAKSMDFEEEPVIDKYTTPEFVNNTQKLIKELQELKPTELSLLMDISPNLAMLNFERFAHWTPEHTPGNAKQAILAYDGDVYEGLDATSFTKKDFEFAQEHLRILSGLYGALRPLDLIKPYRLEMGIKLEADNKKNLYEFWTRKLSTYFKQLLEDQKSNTIVNLASNEYSKAINTNLMEAEIIKPVFKDRKDDSYKLISFYAKKARGLMAAFITKKRIDDKNLEKIKTFNEKGYEYNDNLSQGNEWVFTREKPA